MASIHKKLRSWPLKGNFRGDLQLRAKRTPDPPNFDGPQIELHAEMAGFSLNSHGTQGLRIVLSTNDRTHTVSIPHLRDVPSCELMRLQEAVALFGAFLERWHKRSTCVCCFGQLDVPGMPTCCLSCAFSGVLEILGPREAKRTVML